MSRTRFKADLPALADPIPPIRSGGRGIQEADTTGGEALRRLIAMTKERGITFTVSRADRPLLEWLERYELTRAIDPGRFYPDQSACGGRVPPRASARPRSRCVIRGGP